MIARFRTLAVVMLMAAAGLTGCKNENPTEPPQFPVGFPETPEILMANFKSSYEAMNAAAYTQLLHPAYLTFLQAGTTAQYPDVGTTLDLAEETRIHQRIFGKTAVTDPQGALVPGIADIQFQVLSPLSAWAPSTAGDPIADAEWATYDVVVLFDRGGTYSQMKVRGSVRFCATHRDSVFGGVTKPYYRMRGQVDLTQEKNALAEAGKSEESLSWGTVKAMFWLSE